MSFIKQRTAFPHPNLVTKEKRRDSLLDGIIQKEAGSSVQKVNGTGSWNVAKIHKSLEYSLVKTWIVLLCVEIF